MPMRYLITFTCYGSRLHGDASGTVDRLHNLAGSRLLEDDPHRESAELQRMQQEPYLLDSGARAAVLESMREVCLNRRWVFLAAHVRTNHVHVVVDAEARPEEVMNAFKSYASRALNSVEGGGRKRWARHGSTR